MGYVEVSTRKKFVRPSELSKGDVYAEGVFKGTQAGKRFPNSRSMILDGEDEKGACKYIAPITGTLKQAFEDGTIVPGSKIKIVYMGKFTLESGAFAGTEAHDFKIYKDEDESFEDGDESFDTQEPDDEPLPGPGDEPLFNSEDTDDLL